MDILPADRIQQIRAFFSREHLSPEQRSNDPYIGDIELPSVGTDDFQTLAGQQDYLAAVPQVQFADGFHASLHDLTETKGSMRHPVNAFGIADLQRHFFLSRILHDGEGDVLMKGLCSTDKFLRAILNKEVGLLPAKGLLSHVGVVESPNYHKLMFITDMAVIPAPDFRQKVKLAGFVTGVARSFGIAMPKIAFIAASEQMLDTMPACMEGAMLAKMCDRGQIRGCIGDGPLALDVAIDKESAEIKKLQSPVAGDADCMLFPNIESANVFWKTNTKLVKGVKQAGMLVGTKVPCVLASRADSVEVKLNSIAEAVAFVK